MVDDTGARLKPMVRNLDEAFRQIGELRRDMARQQQAHERTVAALLDTLQDIAFNAHSFDERLATMLDTIETLGHEVKVLHTAADEFPGMAYYLRQARNAHGW